MTCKFLGTDSLILQGRRIKTAKSSHKQVSNNVTVEASAEKLQVSKASMVQLNVVLQEQHAKVLG